MSEKNIYQRINAVMQDCDYLQKKQAQQGKGIKYDEVMAMIRPLLILHGIVMVTNQDNLEALGGVEGTKQKIYQGKYSLQLVNMDKPEDFVTHTSYAHGMDGGDKGPGKAHTYAMKTMLVKGFGIETGEDDESRAEKLDKLDKIKVINQEQYNELAQYCVDADTKWTPIAFKIMNGYDIKDIQSLPASKFNEVMTRIKNNANN